MNLRNKIDTRREYSEKIVANLRQELKDKLPENLAVVVTGSFARKEASDQSDVDYFLLVDDQCRGLSDDEISNAHSIVATAIANANLKNPSEAGAFGKECEALSSFYKNVGGNDDPNIKLTQRLLLILEGDWLFGKDIFNNARKHLIEGVYVRAAISDHQVARFLLNDLIRYWRTIGVDFEYKTAEIGKGWGIRNIKLIYSRKLMYLSGVVMVAETAQSTRAAKVSRLIELAGLTPIERMESVFGESCKKALRLYLNFLENISDEQVRSALEEVTIERNTHTEEFKALKHAGHHFSLQLEQLLKGAYAPSHPIHHAMLF